jgi:hypothetical protein
MFLNTENLPLLRLAVLPFTWAVDCSASNAIDWPTSTGGGGGGDGTLWQALRKQTSMFGSLSWGPISHWKEKRCCSISGDFDVCRCGVASNMLTDHSYVLTPILVRSIQQPHNELSPTRLDKANFYLFLQLQASSTMMRVRLEIFSQAMASLHWQMDK